jgi:hypothetical protein
MADPVTPAAAAALYPDGGNNPAGASAAGPLTTADRPPGAVDPAAAPAAPAAVVEPAKEAELAAKPSAIEGEKSAEKPAEKASPPLDVTAYADLKLPEGFVVEPALMDGFKSEAATLGLKPEAAQGLVDKFLAPALTKQAEAFQAAIEAGAATTRQGFLAELQAMPEFQGEARERNLGLLGRAFDEFGTPEARRAFDVTMAGDNPHIVKMFLGMAEALMEGEATAPGQPGSLASANGRPTGPKSGGQILYPDSTN